MDEQERLKLKAILELGVTEGVAPGFVSGFWSALEPDRFDVIAVGNQRTVPDAQLMTEDTIFDLSSVSKVFATAPLIARLIERKWLDWDTPVARFFPEVDPSILIRHLLAHTSGLPAWAPFWELLRTRFAPQGLESASILERHHAGRELVLTVKQDVPVDQRALYSDLSFLILGYVIEELTQMRLDAAARHFLWKPLGINAFYRPTSRSTSAGVDPRVAATEACPWRGGILQGQVHDDNTWAMGGVEGHAGVFSTARELLHFGKACLEGAVVSPSLTRLMWTRVPLPMNCERTLGWDTPSAVSMLGVLAREPLVGHWGYTGTSLWIHPRRKWVSVLLSNRVHPTRTNELIRAFRPRYFNALAEILKLMYNSSVEG